MQLLFQHVMNINIIGIFLYVFMLSLQNCILYSYYTSHFILTTLQVVIVLYNSILEKKCCTVTLKTVSSVEFLKDYFEFVFMGQTPCFWSYIDKCNFML